MGNITEPGYTVQDRYTCAYFRKVNMPTVVVLPVKYLSFNASVNDNKVLLNWQTSEVVNSGHFEIERSFNGSNFSTIAYVLDGFSNGNIKTYQAKDNSKEIAGKTIVYYRLKQVDIDGKINYSTSLVVKLQSKTGIEMEISPNPFVEKLFVRFNSEKKGNAEIRIMNMAGLTVITKQCVINNGYNNLQIDGLVSLPAGMYVARLISNEEIITNQKIIK